MGAKNISVSIHDVSPNHESELKKIVDRLHEAGIDKTNLLLVPNWHEKNDLRNHPCFVDWIKELKKTGCELAQHGYYHLAPTKQKYAGLIGWLMGEFVAVGMAEFQNLTYAEAFERIIKGHEILTDSGLNAVGFIPPWWQVSKEAENAIIDSKVFNYYMATDCWNLFGRFSAVPITDLKTGKIHQSREICFEPRDKFADYFTKSLAYIITKCEQQKTIRFGIHPPDIRNEELFDYILNKIQEAKKDREIATYSELFSKK